MSGRLDNVSEVHLACRYKRHAWTAPVFYRDGSNTVALMACRDCYAHKEQRLDSRGRIDGTRILYPEGYLLHGSGRTPAVDVRRAMLKRSHIYASRTKAER